MGIKELSEFNKDKNSIISNLDKLAKAYSEWIEDEEEKIKLFNERDRLLGLTNIKMQSNTGKNAERN